MTERNSIVLIGGEQQELPAGDTLKGTIRPIGIWQCAGPHEIRTFASPPSRYEKEVKVTKITADFTVNTDTGTFTFILKAGSSISTLSTVGTVSVTVGTKTASVTVSVVISGDSVWVVEQTAAGTFSGASDVEEVCSITAYTEIN